MHDSLDGRHRLVASSTTMRTPQDTNPFAPCLVACEALVTCETSELKLFKLSQKARSKKSMIKMLIPMMGG
jgi:hypothetical protein